MSSLGMSPIYYDIRFYRKTTKEIKLQCQTIQLSKSQMAD